MTFAQQMPTDMPIQALFNHLDRWRHLPSYQLERRADLFFSFYLPAIIAQHTGTPVSPDLIPELPIRRDLIWPEQPSHTSVKVDYAVFAADHSKVFFVELKTDTASRRDRQDVYLAKSIDIGFRSIVEGIVAISRATKSRQKYGHLLHALAAHNCVRLPDGFDDHLWPTARPGLSALLKQVQVTVPATVPVEVIYVQPTLPAGEQGIDFEMFAAHVETHDDPISARFAESLRRWMVAAGAVRPEQ